jgi:hypothetical protein
MDLKKTTYTISSNLETQDKLENINKKLILQETQKHEFEKKYSNIVWNDLKKQKDNCLTDDSCIHYMDIKTKQIYSWNYYNKKWMQHNEKYQLGLACLFD